MTWNYEEALSYLDAKDVFRTRLGLDRMRKILTNMKMEEPKVTAHIAGTNGKGSVAAFLTSILDAGGYSTGLYTSPHLMDIRERFVTGTGYIPEEAFTLGMDRVKAAEGAVGEEAMYFEALTALFFWWARAEGLDHTIVETGLGGRLDATNVALPRISIITPIAIDHTQHLGSTLEEIAAEKAAIIKEGRPVIMEPQDHRAGKVVETRCEETLSPLIRADRYVDMRLVSAVEKRGNRWGQLVEVVTTLGDYGEVFIPLLGYHQRLNAVTAIRSAEVLRRQGVRLSDQQIRYGIQETCWPARIEFLEKPMPMVLDVSHNPHGARVLANELMRLMTYLEMDSVVVVLGMMNDKDVDGVLAEMTRLRGTMICTQPECERSMGSEELTSRAKDVGGPGLPVVDIPDVGEAVEKAM
ncbi:MAG: hypothetical protein KAT70_09830, partial [Thermoplasmata archaeon]|nr:hypothetical protein [Thermoplasmata archaeon]